MRALAIILVLIWHYFNCQVNAPQTLFVKGLKFFTFFTWSGVDLFFILSGFLIGRILITHKKSPHYFKTFYVRRIFRIFPAYYLIIITFMFALSAGLSEKFSWLMANPFPLYTYLLYLQNFWMSAGEFGPHWLAITWSLAVEEQFYLVLPLFVFLVKDKYLPWIFICGICSAPFFRYDFNNLGSYVLLPARIDALLLGALIAYYHLKGELEKWLKGQQKFLYAVFVLSLCGVFICGAQPNGESIGGIWIHSLLALFYGSLFTITLMLKETSVFSKFLSSKPLAFIAKISFMVYLTHQLFSGLMHRLILNQDPQLTNTNDVLVTLFALLITFLFSAISYRFFEKPFLNFSKRFNY